MIEDIIKKCEEEIVWANCCIDEMNINGNPHGYSYDDTIWFPCWLNAHQELLSFINRKIQDKREVIND